MNLLGQNRTRIVTLARARRALFVSLLLICHVAVGQEGSLRFRSESDARFFFYLNGKKINTVSTGDVELKGLAPRRYHIRIEVDDPYPVAVTKVIKVKRKALEYSVLFNPVRDRIYLRKGAPVVLDAPAEASESMNASPTDVIRQLDHQMQFDEGTSVSHRGRKKKRGDEPLEPSTTGGDVKTVRRLSM